MLKVSSLGQKSIFLIFGCKRPCEYYEFKVDLKQALQPKNNDSSLLGWGTAFDNGNKNQLLND